MFIVFSVSEFAVDFRRTARWARRFHQHTDQVRTLPWRMRETVYRTLSKRINCGGSATDYGFCGATRARRVEARLRGNDEIVSWG
jgi:hypothetical protein